MKTSIDLPDELYRQVKSKSALEGMAVREVATALFSAWVASSAPIVSAAVVAISDHTEADAPQKLWLHTWQELSTRIDAAMEGRGGLVEQLQHDRR